MWTALKPHVKEPIHREVVVDVHATRLHKMLTTRRIRRVRIRVPKPHGGCGGAPAAPVARWLSVAVG